MQNFKLGSKFRGDKDIETIPVQIDPISPKESLLREERHYTDGRPRFTELRFEIPPRPG